MHMMYTVIVSKKKGIVHWVDVTGGLVRNLF